MVLLFQPARILACECSANAFVTVTGNWSAGRAQKKMSLIMCAQVRKSLYCLVPIYTLRNLLFASFCVSNALDELGCSEIRSCDLWPATYGLSVRAGAGAAGAETRLKEDAGAAGAETCLKEDADAGRAVPDVGRDAQFDRAASDARSAAASAWQTAYASLVEAHRVMSTKSKVCLIFMTCAAVKTAVSVGGKDGTGVRTDFCCAAAPAGATTTPLRATAAGNSPTRRRAAHRKKDSEECTGIGWGSFMWTGSHSANSTYVRISGPECTATTELG